MLHEKFSVLLLFLSGRVGLCGVSCTCLGFQLDFKTLMLQPVLTGWLA
jgi:hypothetical protein